MSGIKSLYIISSKMQAQNKELQVVANNVANVNTAGFKRIGMDFRSMVSRKEGENVGVFAQSRPLAVNFEAGSLTPTGNVLDLALQGEGFFAVEVNGQTQYTRNGHFQMDPEGNLINSQGNFVLDTNNAPINIPQGTKEITITAEGTVATETGALADLGIFRFEEASQMKNLGNSLYSAAGDPLLVEEPSVIQGMLEDSNVSAIEETTRLTELMRSYQSASRLVGRVEDLESRVVRDISRMPT